MKKRMKYNHEYDRNTFNYTYNKLKKIRPYVYVHRYKYNTI